MKRAALALGPYVLLLVPFVSAQSPETQSGASVWDVLVAPSMDPEMTAVAENVDIVRDCLHITLLSGTIQFAKPANGVVFAAVYAVPLGLTFLDNTQRHALGIRNQTQLTDFFRSHESSHQWWGQRCRLEELPRSVAL